MFRIFSLVVAVLFILLGLVLGLLNPHEVLFDGYFIQIHLPLSVILAITLILGLLIGAVVIISQVWRAKWQLARCQRQNQKLEADILQLKSEQVMWQTEVVKAQQAVLPQIEQKENQ